MWLAPAALVLIVKRCFEPQASLLRRVDRAGRSGSGNGGSRCASRSGGLRRRAEARCAGRRLGRRLGRRRRQIQRHFPRGEEIFKERGEAGDAAKMKLRVIFYANSTRTKVAQFNIKN